MLIAQNRGCCPPSVRQELTCIAVHSPPNRPSSSLLLLSLLLQTFTTRGCGKA